MALVATPPAAGVWADFSLMNGGPLHRLQKAVGLPAGDAGFVWLGAAVALAAWAPLLALTTAAGTVTSGPILPFLQSVGTHVRLLVAIPLLFIAEVAFDRRVREVIRMAAVSELVPVSQRPVLDAALGRANRWRDGWTVEAAVAAVVVVLAWQGEVSALPSGISTWRGTAPGQSTPAGWWDVLVAVPVFQFLFLRWAARLVMWGSLLRAIGRLDLQLIPTHPDLAGGLGGLGVAHLALAPLGTALSSVIVGSSAEHIMYAGAPINRVVLYVLVMVLATTLVLVAPLLLFTGRLLQTRQHGVIEYGAFGTSCARAFHVKWLRGRTPPADPLAGAVDIEALANLSVAFDVVRRMRILPIARREMLVLVAAVAGPALPLILFVVPLDELLMRGVRTLLRV